MKKYPKVCLPFALLLLISLCACGTPAAQETEQLTEQYPDAKILCLKLDSATLDGAEIEEFDYTWHCDPGVSHDEVADAPAEYYTGTKPETGAAAYIDHELYYFPQLDEEDFQLVNYDGEREWAYYYRDGVHDDYIFATLPQLGNAFPSTMMHSEEEAAENKVLHITEAGTYILRGTWKGQVKVDLGDEAAADENAKVMLVLDGTDIDCTVAPGLIFESVYECDAAWEERESYTEEVDTADAGAVIVIADGSNNTVSGTNVFRMLKTKYKDENAGGTVRTQKKLRKTDGALYSYVTMNILGGEENSGTLTVNAGFEGVDSELHLTVCGGKLTVNSQDDGMNVNEDGVSVIRFLGGEVTLNAALGAEGDGVDSNGFIVIDGGSISVNGVAAPDSALDSENGVYYHAGTVLIDGVEQSYSSGTVFRESGMPEKPGDAGAAPPPGGMKEPPVDRPKDGREPPTDRQDDEMPPREPKPASPQ